MLLGDGGVGCVLALQTASQFRLMKLREIFEGVDRDGDSLPTVRRTPRKQAGCSSHRTLRADGRGTLKFQNK